MLKKRYNKRKFIPLIASAAAAFIVTAGYTEKNSSLFNLTMRINTGGDDYAPSLTEDGSTAVFNSRMPEERSHNIFICKNKNGLWGDPRPVFYKKSSDSNDETPFISADGKTLLFASDRPGGFSPPLTSDGRKRITFDIYISHLVNGSWTEPEILKGTVNTSMNERAPGLSADGKTLYFTRWPYSNPGRSKMYSAKLDDGAFNNVKELPSPINTGNFEIGFRPSYRSGRYYFSSRRPGGSGGWDIYYTTINGRKFTKPVNAGREINSPYDDMYYSESKVNSIMCSDRAGGYGKFDLYSSFPAVKTSVKESGKEITGSLIRIKVIDKKSGKLLKQNTFRILLYGYREKESVYLRKTEVTSSDRGSFTLNPKDDVDSVVIEPVSKKYSGSSAKIHVIPGRAQDFTLYLKEKSASRKTESAADAEIKTSGKNRAVETADPSNLKVIYFKFNSSQVPVEYIPDLHSLVEFLRNNPEYKLTISGHSDSAGSAKSNEMLSMKRANNVSDFIKSLDISGDRISVKWYGESRSFSGRKGARYCSLDRRVELSLEK